jgi:hypothetical protein
MTPKMATSPMKISAKKTAVFSVLNSLDALKRSTFEGCKSPI